MADLRPNEVEKCRECFDVFDFAGESKVDAFDLGDLLRACELVPTLALIEKNGGTKKRGEKMLTLEEFLPIYSQIKKEKECGAIEDFMEGLKVYDKAENGMMMAGELAHVLMSLGEKLTDVEVDEIMKLAGTEDDEGFIKYELFCRAVMTGPFPEEEKK